MAEYSCSEGINISRNSVTPEYWDTHNIDDSHRNGAIIEAFILLLFVLVGAPSNALIIISIIQQKLYNQSTHILLLNLAVSDFLTCTLVIPLIFVAGFAGGYVFGVSDYMRCQVCQTGLILTALAVFSINVVGMMSLDRFIFIKFPLHYDKFVTVPRVIFAVILVWLLSIAQSLIPLSGFGLITYGRSISACTLDFEGIFYAILVVGLSLIPVAITIITNIWIACIVRKQIRMIYRTRRSFGNREALKEYNQKMRKKIRGKRHRKQLALLRAFGAIIITNFISWIPLVVYSVLLLIIDEDLIPVGIDILSFLSFLTHSVFHPLIEGCFIPEIKHTFKKVLGLEYFQRRMKKRIDARDDDAATESAKCFCCGHKNSCEICMLAFVADVDSQA